VKEFLQSTFAPYALCDAQDGVFLGGPRSLLNTLHRLTEKGWIEGEWTESETKRRVKTYTLTASGRAQLAEEKRNWKNVFTAMNRALTEES